MDKQDITKYYNKNRNLIENRLKEFSEKQESPSEIIKELVFCILTPMSNPEKILLWLENESDCMMLIEMPVTYIEEKIAKRVRFHKSKARYLRELSRRGNNYKIATDMSHIETIKKDVNKYRNWLVNTVLGIGMKEASHFLRNCGIKDIAILDRHILRALKELEIIESDKYPKNADEYLAIEKKYLELAQELKLNGAELDLTLFGMKSGRILK